MEQPFEPTAFLDIIAERLAKARHAFAHSAEALQAIPATLTFEWRTMTLLCLEDPCGTCLPGELAEAAGRHGGRMDRFTTATALASFSRATNALELAMELQRDGAKYRVALVTGHCIAVKFQLEGRAVRMIMGKGVAQAEALIHRVPNGTIHVSAETYPLLQDDFDATGFGGLVFAEFMDDSLLEATITMPPDSDSDMSTFAGLGLTDTTSPAPFAA